MNLFEKIVGSVDNSSWQIDPVCHVTDFFEGINQGSVWATHLKYTHKNYGWDIQNNIKCLLFACLCTWQRHSHQRRQLQNWAQSLLTGLCHSIEDFQTHQHEKGQH